MRIGFVNIFHRTLWLFSERKNYVQSPWEISLRNADWIIVTSDIIEYFGWLAAYSTHEQKREIVLGAPEIIVRDEKGEESETIPCGRQLIILEEKIAKIVVVSYKKTFWERRKDESVKKKNEGHKCRKKVREMNKANKGFVDVPQ